MTTNHAIRTAARKAAFKARQARIIATQSRSGLAACERLVIATIGPHENLETGQCNPGIDTLAQESGLHERAIYRAIVGAERKGALIVTRAGNGGRNRPNGYQLVPPKATENPDNLSGKKTLTKRSRNPDTLSPELEELRSEGGASTKHPHSHGERDDHYRDLESSIASGRAALRAAAEAFEEPESHLEADPGGTSPRGQRRVDEPAATKSKPRFERGLSSQPSASPPAEDDGAHAAQRALFEVRGLWRRGHPADDTPKAIAITRAIFVKVTAQGTPPEEIVAAAKVWVAAFAAADGLAYLPQLATWLTSRGFEQSPPAKRKRRKSGSVRRDRLPRQNGKVDLTALTLKRAGYVEDENGNLYHPDGNAGSAFWWRASS